MKPYAWLKSKYRSSKPLNSDGYTHSYVNNRKPSFEIHECIELLQVVVKCACMVLTLTALSYITYDLYYHFIATIIHLHFATKHIQGSFYHIADGFILGTKQIVNSGRHENLIYNCRMP